MFCHRGGTRGCKITADPAITRAIKTLPSFRWPKSRATVNAKTAMTPNAKPDNKSKVQIQSLLFETHTNIGLVRAQ